MHQSSFKLSASLKKLTPLKDLVEVFSDIMKGKFGNGYFRVNVLFDRYLKTSNKDGTYSDPEGLIRPIRRVIDSRSVKLPQSWNQFLTHSKKQSRVDFVSE